MTPLPDLAAVRAWIDTPPSEIGDDLLQGILDAEISTQLAYVVLPDWADETEYPVPLAQALLRRCARAVAARGLPLGSLPIQMTGSGAEFAATAQLVPRLDVEIERYEAPFRPVVIA
jgi:hypothetical protein